MSVTCRWCGGSGRQHIERGSSLSYRCPDCDGTGHLPECDVCGEPYSGDYCEDCYAECEGCREVCLIENMQDGLCEACVEK